MYNIPNEILFVHQDSWTIWRPSMPMGIASQLFLKTSACCGDWQICRYVVSSGLWALPPTSCPGTASLSSLRCTVSGDGWTLTMRYVNIKLNYVHKQWGFKIQLNVTWLFEVSKYSFMFIWSHSFNNEVLEYCFMSGPLTLILFYFVTACGSPAPKSELGAEIIMI